MRCVGKDTECYDKDKRCPAPGPFFFGGGGWDPRGSTPIFTWERISRLLRWLFSSEKICESFLKVDNRSLEGVGGAKGGVTDQCLGRSEPRWGGGPAPPLLLPSSPANGAPAPLEAVNGVGLQGRQYGAQGGEISQFAAALGGGRGVGVLVTSQARPPARIHDF